LLAEGIEWMRERNGRAKKEGEIDRKRERADVRSLAIELPDGSAHLAEDVVHAILSDEVVGSHGGEIVVGIGRVE
jgi:hypothetical protein